jgi:hypothetical protein
MEQRTVSRGTLAAQALGFIFAEGDTQDQVEKALGVARERLRIMIQ